MKNFLALNNLILNEKDSITNIIKSSSEVSECLITNVLEENSSSIWISNEELPQEIIINLSRSFFKEYPKKLTAIGIYCWHAYPTNPKLIEILISKNNDNNFISFGNFDLCLKPGRQLLQLDEENDTNFLITENNNYIIKIIIKETYGDKRTYINNIYLYENIDFISAGKINTNTFETIKEEDDSSSIFYLRESRERTLPRKKNNNKINNKNNSANNINNNNQNNIVIKVNDELNNKDLTIDEFEIITKSKVIDNKKNEKNPTNKSINNLNINNTYDNDDSNINLNTNNNIFGIDTQFNATYSEISEKNNNILKTDDLTNKNILLTKTNDNIDEALNDSNKKISINKSEKENDKKENKNINDNNFKKSTNNIESFDASLSSEDLESLGILKGTKTHQKNFFNPPKNSEINDDELDNIEFQHSLSEFKFKTKNDIINKKFTENYFNMQNSNNSNKQNKNKNMNIPIYKNSNSNSNNVSQNIINKNNNNNNNDIKINNYQNNNNNEEDINQLKEEMILLKNEFQNYKKE